MLVKVASCDLYVNPEKIVKIRKDDDTPNKIEIHFDNDTVSNVNLSKESKYYDNLDLFVEDLRKSISEEMSKGWVI
jgi:hypothetical protein